MDQCYLCIILAILTVLVLGCWNPRSLQVKQDGVATGQPNYVWLAFWGLVVGVVVCFLYDQQRRGAFDNLANRFRGYASNYAF